MFRVSVFLLLGLTAGGAGIHAFVTAKNRQGWQRLHPDVASAPLDGSLPALLRARLVAGRALVVTPDDGHLLADTAFVEALLALDYGLPSVRAAEDALARATSPAAWPRPSPALVLGTRALLALGRGDEALALELGRTAAEPPRELGPEDARPLLALGRAQLTTGDLRAASAVFEAASARAPRAAAPLVGWAEAQLGAGQRSGTREALEQAVHRAPGHTRALLLHAEVSALGAPMAAPAQPPAGEPHELKRQLASACVRDRELSPTIQASCTLLSAVHARLHGDRQAAVNAARATVAVDSRASARDVALAAILLTHLGEVDAADQAVTRLRQRLRGTRGGALSDGHPLLAWAQVTVAASRGLPPPRALPPFPQHPETRLSAAREVLAEGGRDGLAALLQELGEPALLGDPDLRALARMVAVGEPVTEPPSEPAGDGAEVSPALAFVEGLRAQWAGDIPTSVRWLQRALNHHADACRAAGHYLPALAMLGRPPGNELDGLRLVNQQCAELQWTEDDPAVELATPAP